MQHPYYIPLGIVEATRAQLYEKIDAIREAIGDSNYSITNLPNWSAADVNTLVTSSTEHIYALLKLNPFIITGADYSHLNQNGELDKENYSEGFLEDRALFLYHSMHKDALSPTGMI